MYVGVDSCSFAPNGKGPQLQLYRDTPACPELSGLARATPLGGMIFLERNLPRLFWKSLLPVVPGV